jgi:hypothetical protein
MSGQHVRDLERRFTIAGRSFHVILILGDQFPKPLVIANDDFDAEIFTCQKDLLSDFDFDEPNQVALARRVGRVPRGCARLGDASSWGCGAGGARRLNSYSHVYR